MGTFGERLRREREMRNVSLDEIAATTKIGTRLLRALEDEQFDVLPGGIFNKGYVRAYARCIGIDEEQAIADYLEAQQAATGSHPAGTEKTPIRTERFTREEQSIPRRSPLPLIPVLVALVLLAGLAGAWRLYRERQVERRQSAATAPSNAAKAHAAPDALPATPVPVPPESSVPTMTGQTSQIAAASAPTVAPTHAATAPSDGTFELTVRPKDRAWVSIKADGKFVVRGIIKPPDVKTIHATVQVVFWTGNAGAVEVSFNGNSVPLTGGENEERVLVFNARGLLPGSAAQ